jgi:dipeptidyl-peptidase-4
MTDTFPRQQARTQRFNLGEPRTITVSPDGQRVVFLRSRGGSDPITCLWVYDVATGAERLVADPLSLLADDPSDLPTEELDRRERAREAAGGITAYATDADVRVVAFALGGRLFVGGLVSGTARELRVDGPVFDPRPDPTARRVAYVSGRSLRIAELDGTSWELVGEDDPNVSWGSADFIAAEEMRRFRGYWWSPDGQRIAACRVDETAVDVWHIADPAEPARAPRTVRYPAAGRPNAVTEVHVLDLEGGAAQVWWDNDRLPYLADARWIDADRLLLTVQSRDQQQLQVLEADTTAGDTVAMWTDHDPQWVELVAGTPATLDDGRLVTAADRDGVRRLLVDDQPVTPTDLQVRAVVAAAGDTITLLANPIDDATVLHVWQWRADELRQCTSGTGVHTAAAGGPTLVIRSSVLASTMAVTSIVHHGDTVGTLSSFAEPPLVEPNLALRVVTDRRLAAAVLLPHHHDGSPLPVLVDPYGGPHAQRVLATASTFVAQQWFADQGFAVVVTDGRGTPGRGSRWEHNIHRDLATAALDDQVDALHALAEEFPLDLDRVAIRGWSYGGYLAALAVLRRPDVFHAAVAGAPVTDWRLYDTHYTERYLGDPTVDDGPYSACSLVEQAHLLTRPLLLVHGLADDNVVAAHTLQLSAALLAAGRPHEVLPLVGVTHMTPQEVVAEHLLLHQLDFVRRALA